MSNSIGSASLQVGTDYSDLSSGLDSIFSQVDGFRSRIDGIFSTMGIGTDSTAGLGGVLGDLSNIERRVSAIGARSAEYMGLARAAERAGIAETTFSQVLTGMQARIGSAQFGEDAARSLGFLKVNLQELRGMTPDAQFMRLADSIKAINDPTLRAYAAQKLFGDQGRQLLPILSQGSAGLAQFVARQKQIGTAFGEDQLQKVSAYRDTIYSISGYLDGMHNKLMIAITPALTNIVNTVDKWLQSTPELDKNLVRIAEDLSFIGSALFMEIFQVFVDIVDMTLAWFGATEQAGGSMEELDAKVFGVVKKIGFAVLKGWDFAESIVAVGIKIDEYMSIPMDFVIEKLLKLMRIAAALNPFEDQRKQMEGFVDSLESIHDIKKGAREWASNVLDGRNLVGNMQEFSAWMDKVEHKKRDVVDGFKGTIPKVFDELPKVLPNATNLLSKALQSGSTDEYSVRVRFQVGNSDIQNQQLQELKKAATLLGGIFMGVSDLKKVSSPQVALKGV